MCNIVTEFYLYSIVYIYLINSRLDVTYSVRHHFRTLQTLSINKNRTTLKSSVVFFYKLNITCDKIGKEFVSSKIILYFTLLLLYTE